MSRQEDVQERGRRFTDDHVRERLLAGIPVTERRLEVGGVWTAVLEGGDGPPMVLLHGGIETGGVYWAPVTSRLAESYRLVVPDVPGLGESEPVAGLEAVAFAEWFAGLLQVTCRPPTRRTKAHLSPHIFRWTAAVHPTRGYVATNWHEQLIARRGWQAVGRTE
jgi:pimeloyl-ACP methyl ester carboxylesterase